MKKASSNFIIQEFSFHAGGGAVVAGFEGKWIQIKSKKIPN